VKVAVCGLSQDRGRRQNGPNLPLSASWRIQPAPTPHGNFESSRDDSDGLIQIKNLGFTRIVSPIDGIAGVGSSAASAFESPFMLMAWISVD
jgi:hypothetical protein